MVNEVVKLEQKSCKDTKEISMATIRKSLSENNACYVLITCGVPADDGKMDVQMFYEGDEDLASFIVDNAQQVFDDRSKFEKSH